MKTLVSCLFGSFLWVFHRGSKHPESGGFGSDRFYRGMSDANIKIESVTVEDLLCNPGRRTRPEHLVVILRGLPGSGKSHVAKLLKVRNHHTCTKERKDIPVCACVFNRHLQGYLIGNCVCFVRIRRFQMEAVHHVF